MARKKNVVIKTENLKKTFGTDQTINEVLKGIDLEIYSGEFVVIFGPSGCGKTTFLNCLIGLEPPDSGKIIVRGKEITAMEENEQAEFRAKKFGMVYQMAYWIKALTVAENIALPLTIAGVREDYALRRARKMLRRVGIGRLTDQVPTELSGGEQQRAGLARALVSWPWIIVADEPTGNLDIESGKELMELLKMLSQEQRRTVILVTHNIDYLQYATRKIAMEDGRLIGDTVKGTKDIVEKLEKKIDLLRKEKKEIGRVGE